MLRWVGEGLPLRRWHLGSDLNDGWWAGASSCHDLEEEYQAGSSRCRGPTVGWSFHFIWAPLPACLVDTSHLTAPELISSLFLTQPTQWMISLFLLVLSLFTTIRTSGQKTFPVERKTVNIFGFEDHATLWQLHSSATAELKQTLTTCKPTSVAVFQENFMYGRWHSSFHLSQNIIFSPTT